MPSKTGKSSIRYSAIFPPPSHETARSSVPFFPSSAASCAASFAWIAGSASCLTAFSSPVFPSRVSVHYREVPESRKEGRLRIVGRRGAEENGGFTATGRAGRIGAPELRVLGCVLVEDSLQGIVVDAPNVVCGHVGIGAYAS